MKTLHISLTSALLAGLLIVSAMVYQTGLFLREAAETPTEVAVDLGAVPNIYARVASTSQVIVGLQNGVTVFSARDNCASRAITTVAQPIMLSFDSNITPNGTRGHLQAASTTISYDSELYGCGPVTAYGFVASTTITRTEFGF